MRGVKFTTHFHLGMKLIMLRSSPLSRLHYCPLFTYLPHGAESFFEKLTSLQLVKKFSAFYVTGRFIAVLTSARHLSLSPANTIQSIPPHSTS